MVMAISSIKKGTMVRPSGKAPGREQMTEDAVDDTFHKRYDSYVPDDDIDEEVMEGRDDAPARHQIADAVSVYSLQSCPARAEAALISSKKSKAASSVTSRQSRAVTIKVDNRACNSGIQQEWHELDDDSSSAAASRHQDVTHILSGLSSLTSDCSSAVASAKSPKSIRSVFSKRSHSSVPSAASGSSRRSYPTTKSTPSVTSRQSTSSSAAASRQHDATSIMSGSASPTLDCSSEVASAKSRKSTRSASSKKSHSLPSEASVSSRRSYSTTKSTPSATSRQSTAVAVNELGDSSSSAAVSHQHDATSIRSESTSPAIDCSSEVASAKSRKSTRSASSKKSHSSVPSTASVSSRRSYSTAKSTPSATTRQSTALSVNELGDSSSAAASVASAKSRKSIQSIFSKRSRNSVPGAASVSSREAFPDTQSCSGFFVSEGVSDCSSEEGEIIPPSVSSRQSTAAAVNELSDSSSAAASRHQDATSIRSGSASPALDCNSEVASAKSRKSTRSVFSKRSHISVPSAASVSSRRSYPTTKSTPSVSSRQSRSVAVNELGDSSSAAASRHQDATSKRSGSASPTPDCSLQEASTSAKSHISIPSVVSTGSRSRKSKSSNKSPINSKFETKLPDVIAEEGDNEDTNNTDIVTRHAASVSSRRSCPTAKSTPSSRQSRVIAAAEDNRSCSSGLKQDWHELGDSPSAAASLKQAEATCIISGLSSLTSDCSLEEASTSAKSRKSMRSVFSKGSRSRKSKSSKKSSIKSKLEMKVTPTIIAEEEENDDDVVDIVTHRRSSNHSAEKERSSTPSNHQVLKQNDLEFWSALAVRVAMAVMRAKGTEMMAQKASMMIHEEGQRHGGRELSREMMSLLSTKLSMAILEAGGDGKVASAVMIAVMMASDNNQDVISMLSDNNSTDPSVVPSVASTVQSDRLKPTERGSIKMGSPKGSSTTKSKKRKKEKKTSQANQSPKEANQSPSREETVSASLSVGSSTSDLKRSQLEYIQKEMDEKKRQLESLEMEVENAKKRATEEAERLLKTESIKPDRSKLDYILKEREQKQQQLQITRNEIEAKKRAAREAMRLEYMLMEFEKRKKALEEEELRNCLKRAENVLHQELAKINSDLGKVGEREVDKASLFMDLIWHACCTSSHVDSCGTTQGEESLYTDDWTIPSSMSFEHQPYL